MRRPRVPLRGLAAGSFLLVWLACGRAPDAPVGAEPGAPLRGLHPAELARFAAGKALFNKIFTPAEGLGPLFNENQCSACHTDPVSGGDGEQRVVKASHFVAPAACDALQGGRGLNVRRQATAALKALGVDRETVPPEATEHGRFAPPFLFGLGLVEAIPEADILARADPEDRNHDGISGRPGRTPQGAFGRFGRKADVATITDFVASALRLEMGITSPLAPAEQGLNGGPLPPGTDPAPDPEVDRETVERLADFVRFLAPLPGPPLAADARRDSVLRGERVFASLGCPSCHVPSMTTGKSRVPALDRKAVYLYSDLLLHDLGPDLASVCGAGAQPGELRTAILAGLSYRKTFLHDGRALDVRGAILAHGGEASAARAAFAELDPISQQLLLVFLETL